MRVATRTNECLLRRFARRFLRRFFAPVLCGQGEVRFRHLQVMLRRDRCTIANPLTDDVNREPGS